MLIGNRRRPQMQRTTKITIEIDDDDDDRTIGQESEVNMAMVDGGDKYDQRSFLAVFSPGNHGRNERRDRGQSSLSPSSSFLGNCGFCKNRLAPGRDIYMYKGDAAFCSVECREQQMDHDEGKPRNDVVLPSSN